MITPEQWWTYDRLAEFIYSSHWEESKVRNAQDIIKAIKLIEQVKLDDRDKIKFVQKDSYCGSGRENDGGYFKFFFNNIVVDGVEHSFDILGRFEIKYDDHMKFIDDIYYIKEIRIDEEAA